MPSEFAADRATPILATEVGKVEIIECFKGLKRASQLLVSLTSNKVTYIGFSHSANLPVMGHLVHIAIAKSGSMIMLINESVVLGGGIPQRHGRGIGGLSPMACPLRASHDLFNKSFVRRGLWKHVGLLVSPSVTSAPALA
jgi:hypothetical protein